jgi:hypothetical protein
MLRTPEDNIMLRAALSRTIRVDGEHYQIAPWMELLIMDLTKLGWRMNVGTDFASQISQHSRSEFVWQMNEVLHWKEDLLKEYELAEVGKN